MRLRSSHHRSRRMARQARTIPIYGNPDRGDGLDAGVYFRCWNCGFICNTARDDLGDSQSVGGDYPEEAIRGSLGEWEGDQEMRSRLATLGGPIHAFPIIELGPDGVTAKTIYQTFNATVVGGCPFCGTRNYRGDYP